MLLKTPQLIIAGKQKISVRTRLESVPVTKNVRSVTGTWIVLKRTRVSLTPKQIPPPPGMRNRPEVRNGTNTVSDTEIPVVHPLRSHSETERDDLTPLCHGPAGGGVAGP
ncbi:hypothetical protein DFH28DRAFT_1133255 [Melampsora americana]|nr:hypothetical protein DFH28DRAFT_1133255 [Melampsora americana]